LKGSEASAAPQSSEKAGATLVSGAESAESVPLEKPLRGQGVFHNTDTKTIDKVFGTLFRLQFNYKLEFAEKLPEDKLNLFVELVKYFIENDLGRHWGFYIEFNNTYTASRKFKYW